MVAFFFSFFSIKSRSCCRGTLARPSLSSAGVSSRGLPAAVAGGGGGMLLLLSGTTREALEAAAPSSPLLPHSPESEELFDEEDEEGRTCEAAAALLPLFFDLAPSSSSSLPFPIFLRDEFSRRFLRIFLSLRFRLELVLLPPSPFPSSTSSSSLPSFPAPPVTSRSPRWLDLLNQQIAWQRPET